MIPDAQDLPPFDVPDVIHACRVKDVYDIRLLPGGFLRGEWTEKRDFRVEVSWNSARTGRRESFAVGYTISCYQDDIWISRDGGRNEIPYHPFPKDHETMTEYGTAWRRSGAEELVQSLKLEIGRFTLVDRLEKWRRAFTMEGVVRRQELIEDMWFFADQAMTALITQFPDEEHVFPMPVPEIPSGLGM